MQPTPVFLPGNPMHRGTWQATVHSIAKRQTRLKQLSTAKTDIKSGALGTFLMVQGLRLSTPHAGGPGSIPGQGTRTYMPELQPSMAK